MMTPAEHNLGTLAYLRRIETAAGCASDAFVERMRAEAVAERGSPIRLVENGGVQGDERSRAKVAVRNLSREINQQLAVLIQTAQMLHQHVNTPPDSPQAIEAE